MSDNQVFMDPLMLKEEKDEACFRSIPPGYRFKPRDDEIIKFYLRPKIFGLPLPPNRIKEVFLYNYDPQTLTAMSNNALSNGVGNEYYFFTPRDRKYANGSRPARNAGNGFWKASGADKLIFRKGKKIGLKKSLAFYQGKPPKGDKTNWLMHEYVLTDAPIRKRLGNEDMRLDDWVLCRVYKNPREKKLEHETLQEGHQEEVEAEADTSAILPYDGPLYEPINVQMPQGTSSWFPEQVSSTPCFNQYGDYMCEHPTLGGSNMPDYGVFEPALFQSNMQQHFSSDFENGNPREKKLEHETLQEGHQEEAEAEADTSAIVAYDGAQMVQQEGHQVDGEAEADTSAIPPYNGTQMVENGIAFAPLYEPINTSSQMLQSGIAALYEPINTSSQMLQNGIAFAPLYEPINVQMPQGTSSWFPEQLSSTLCFNQYGDYMCEHPTLGGSNMPDYGVFEPALFQNNMQQHFSSDFDLPPPDQFNQDPHTGLPPPYPDQFNQDPHTGLPPPYPDQFNQDPHTGLPPPL